MATQSGHLESILWLRSHSGERSTEGIEGRDIERFIQSSPSLGRAIDNAVEARSQLGPEIESLLPMDEGDLCELLQRNLVNFYPEDGISPYVPLGAAGPWIVTTHGAVLHDSAGYGMLGLGHAPAGVLGILSEPFVMANVMTPSLSQKRLTDRLLEEIGRQREGSCPMPRFVFMNSGSEAMSVASRITDIHAKRQTEAGGPHAGRPIRRLALDKGFHGRTYRPAQLSDCTRTLYTQNLASYSEDSLVGFVPINDVEALQAAFARAESEGVFIEALSVEPVLGEGDSGLAMTREFYDAARDLTLGSGALLVVDSIQAALRAHGVLSIIDYPGFEDCTPPDMETYSKALNAGQYPLSVLAMTEPVADIYVRGVYGNTMTTSPRGLEVAYAVLGALDDNLRRNVRERGEELVEKLTALGGEFPGAIAAVRGTGLIVCAELNRERYRVAGRGGFEEYCRKNGIAMIHGGSNGLRFTPHLAITSEELDLIVRTVRSGLESLDGTRRNSRA